MSFIHDDRDFRQLLNFVTEERGIAPALARISTMFWAPRIAVDDACATIREWIRGNLA